MSHFIERRSAPHFLLVKAALIIGASLACVESADALTVNAQVLVGASSTQQDSDSSSSLPVVDAGILKSGTFGNGIVSESGFSEASAGRLRAVATVLGSASATGGGDLFAKARAVWSDAITITSPFVPNGQVGSFTSSIVVGGSLQVDFAGRGFSTAGSGAFLDIFPGGNIFNGGRVALGDFTNLNKSSDTGVTRQGNINDSFLLPFTVQFTYGLPIAATFTLEATAGARLLSEIRQAGPGSPVLIGNGTTFSSASYGSTLYWGGITNLTNNAGQLITEFSAVGTSGFDYRPAAVPLPAAQVLMFTGIGALVVRLRRGSQNRIRSSSV